MAAAWQVCLADFVPKIEWDRLLVPGLVAVGAILSGALFIYWLNRWRTRPDAAPLTANEQLANFRELYEEGEISEKEFERIKARLAPLVREELNIPATRSGESEPATPSTPPESEARQENSANAAKITGSEQNPDTQA
jgi:hypothetical protein